MPVPHHVLTTLFAGRSTPLRAVDPLSVFDAANGTEFVAKFTLEDTAVTSNPSATIVGDEVHLRIGTTSTNGGGTGGSFWFDSTGDGVLWWVPVTGAFDARLQCRVRNHAGTASPPFTAFRIFALAAHDPLRTALNYLHEGAGSTGAGVARLEWKSTDGIAGGSTDTSAFGAINAPTLDLDFRIVRDPNDLDRFVLFWRATDPGVDLLADTGWNAFTGGGLVNGVILRDSNATPDRNTLGATADLAIPLPSTLRVGPVLYANQASHDISGFVRRFTLRTPTVSP